MVCSSYRSGSMLLLSLSLRPKATSIGTTVMCWQIFISRDNLLQVRASAPWLSAFVGSPPVRSSPRVVAPCARQFLALCCFLGLRLVPGEPCEFFESPEIAQWTLWSTKAPGKIRNCTSKTFWSTQKSPGRNDVERSCDKTWRFSHPEMLILR